MIHSSVVADCEFFFSFPLCLWKEKPQFMIEIQFNEIVHKTVNEERTEKKIEWQIEFIAKNYDEKPIYLAQNWLFKQNLSGEFTIWKETLFPSLPKYRRNIFSSWYMDLFMKWIYSKWIVLILFLTNFILILWQSFSLL